MKLSVIIFITLMGFASNACSQTNSLSNTPLSKDQAIFELIIEKSENENWSKKSLDTILISTAKYFIDTPYVGGTLDINSSEQLVINLRELDCLTLVENVLAISRCIEASSTSFKDYKKQLTTIRYRDGIINEYPSRLHYFTDWLDNNKKKGIIAISSEDYGTKQFIPSVGFMSTNPTKYKALSENKDFIPIIKKDEERINNLQLKYLPKESFVNYEDKIKDGDIIAISTTTEGLDIAHVGFAIKINNRVHMLHASSTAKKVVITNVPLVDYLLDIGRFDGILVASPKVMNDK